MFNEEREVLTINRVKAVVKDIKVSGKGIVLNLENVQLTGTQISEVSALVGGMVYIDLEERLPESRKVEKEADGQLSFEDVDQEPEVLESLESEETLSDDEVADQLNLEQ